MPLRSILYSLFSLCTCRPCMPFLPFPNSSETLIPGKIYKYPASIITQSEVNLGYQAVLSAFGTLHHLRVILNPFSRQFKCMKLSCHLAKDPSRKWLEEGKVCTSHKYFILSYCAISHLSTMITSITTFATAFRTLPRQPLTWPVGGSIVASSSDSTTHGSPSFHISFFYCSLSSIFILNKSKHYLSLDFLSQLKRPSLASTHYFATCVTNDPLPNTLRTRLHIQ